MLRIATPLIFGTLGVLLCERAGVLNLGIEGIMVAGAFTGWLAVYHGAGLWTGVLVAALHRRGLRPAARRCSPCRSRCRSTCPASASRCSPPASSYYAYRVSFPKVTSPPTIEPFARDALAASGMPVLGAQTPLTLLALAGRAVDRVCSEPHARSASRCAWSARIPAAAEAQGINVIAVRIGAIVAGSRR